jgi:hypothetical protein
MSTSPEHTSWVDADDFDGEVDHDFDAAWAEVIPKRVKIKGKVYTLPAELPASVMILAARRQRSKSGRTDTFQQFEEIFGYFMTPAAYQQLLADGLGIGQLNQILDYCLHAYGIRTQSAAEEEPEGEAAPPATGATGSA